jgi:hypothetical protein
MFTVDLFLAKALRYIRWTATAAALLDALEALEALHASRVRRVLVHAGKHNPVTRGGHDGA